MAEIRESIQSLKEAICRSVIGQDQVVDALLLALLANGNVLLEGLPGTAKTRSIKTLASVLDASLGRIQFTPDLLPSDVTGTEVYHDEGGEQRLQFQPGPLFNNLVLADEINRAPAKVQSALLEAMEERQVTVAGKTYKLPALFLVLATQNPIEQEGTYPLPEAQMDRFLLKIRVDYPQDDAEMQIIRLVRGEESQPPQAADQTRIDQQLLFAAREQVRTVHVSDTVERYMVALVMATRHPERYGEELAGWIAVGSSPRATIALDRCARAQAWLQGKDFVDPDDVRRVLPAVMRHRLILGYEAQAEGITPDRVIAEIMRSVAVA